MPSQTGSGRVEELDVLRGLAALSVVVFHYVGHCARYFNDFNFDFTYGKYGVQLFFVISGFVIYFTLEKCRDWRDFAFSRFSRLFPSYWTVLMLLISANLFLLKKKVYLAAYAINMTMLQKFIGFPDLDIVYWSLAVELAFYLNYGLKFYF